MSILEQTKTIEQVKQELGPIKASQILRMTKVPQYFGGLGDGMGRFCAVGAIYTHFGWDGSDGVVPDDLIAELHKLLPRDVTYEITKWNDREYLSFEQIADKLEEMGY